MNPPNPGFSYSADLPCEFSITRADTGDESQPRTETAS
jgi:hypothetical protein